MAEPLYTSAEVAKYEKQRKDLMVSHVPWVEIESLDKSHQIQTVRRAQARAEEFLSALIVMVGYRGGKYVDFDSAFAGSDSEEFRKDLNRFNTPEVRRDLYTILRALTEIPKSWAFSALARFLRGTGKQGNAKYHGAGRFGVTYGWKASEVDAVCRIVAGHNGQYAQVLMSYADVAEEIRATDPDFAIVDYDAEFKAVRAERDIPFLNKLCSMLETAGLADVPTPQEVKPKKPRTVKVFSPGDVIRLRDLRDLPLPALVRVPIEKSNDGVVWTKSFLDSVVVKVGNFGYYRSLPVVEGKAYGRHSEMQRKDWLEGATFLGVWSGKVLTNQTVRINFRYRKPEKK